MTVKQPARQQAEIKRTIHNARTVWNVPRNSNAWETREPRCVAARQMASVWLNRHRKLTSREVGQALNRERTMVTTYAKNHRIAMAHDAEYRDRWEEFLEIQYLSL